MPRSAGAAPTARPISPPLSCKRGGMPPPEVGTFGCRPDERSDAVFERFKTPEELYNFKLGAALTMEHTVLAMLGDHAEAARSSELADLFRITRTRPASRSPTSRRPSPRSAGSSTTSPAPPSRASRRRARPTSGRPAPHWSTPCSCAGAAETEHHEIAVYEGLITHAYAMGNGAWSSSSAREPRARAAHPGRGRSGSPRGPPPHSSGAPPRKPCGSGPQWGPMPILPDLAPPWRS